MRVHTKILSFRALIGISKVALLALVLAGPGTSKVHATTPVLVVCKAAGQQSPDSFVERALELGLQHSVLSGFDDLTNPPVTFRDWVQTGLALGDVDGDGDLDAALCGGPLPNRLLLQQIDGTFLSGPGSDDIRSGELDRAPSLGDFDRDGDLDLFIGAFEGDSLGTTVGRSRLYENDGSGRFEDVSARSGTRGGGRTLHAIWYDLDLDGWLDLYLSEFAITPNRTYRNNSDGSFADVTDAWGIDDPGNTHVSAIFDADGNGWADVVVGNDYSVGAAMQLASNYPDSLHAGSGPGLFSDVSVGSGADQAEAIMGLALGDVDYDGSLDVYKTDGGPNWLLTNHGWPTSGQPWLDKTSFYGVANGSLPHPKSATGFGPTVGWSTAFVDVDLDRWVDLWVVNGHVSGKNSATSFFPRNQPNALYRSAGPQASFRFEDATQELGLFDEVDDRASAVGDVDRDGDIDICVMATAGRLRYFENRLERDGKGFLTVEVEAGTSGPDGLGSQVRWVAPDSIPHVRAIGGSGPTASQDQHFAHFGLGLEPAVDVEVALPSGITLTLPQVPANTHLKVVEPQLFELSTTKVAAGDGPDTLPSQVTVRVFAHDSSGAALDSSAVIGIDLPGATPIDQVTSEGGNAFSRSFAAPSSSGLHRVQISIDGWVPAIAPVIHAVGAVDGDMTITHLSTEAVRAGSSDPVVMTVTPRDAHGVALGGGRAVEIDLPGFSAEGPVTDLGDGRYRRTFAAAVQAGVVTSTVLIDGVTPAQTPRVEVAGAVAAGTTQVKLYTVLPHEPASPEQLKIRVTPRDANGLRLGSAAQVELVLSEVEALGQGSPSGPQLGAPSPTGQAQAAGASTVLGPLAPTTRTGSVLQLFQGLEDLPREDGAFFFVVERQTDDLSKAKGVLEIFVEGSSVGSAPISF